MAGEIDDAHGTGSDPRFNRVRPVERLHNPRHAALFLSLGLRPRKGIADKIINCAAGLQVRSPATTTKAKACSGVIGRNFGSRFLTVIVLRGRDLVQRA